MEHLFAASLFLIASFAGLALGTQIYFKRTIASSDPAQTEPESGQELEHQNRSGGENQ